MNNNQANQFQPFAGNNSNMDQFNLNQIRNQTAYNNNQNATDILGSLMNVNSNHNNNSNNDTDNPLNSAMSNADIETILHLQKQTDQFHEHLSSFINTHLPSLPDTMELMDKLSYDFNKSNDSGNSNSNSNSNLPRLDSQQESMIETLNRDVLKWKTKAIKQESELKKLRAENQQLKSKLNMLENQLIGTRHVALNGGGPRLDGIEFVKYEGNENGANEGRHYKHTKGVDKLKKSTRSQYDTSKWKIEGDEALYHYFDSILAFLNENEENVVVPHILIPNKNKNKNKNKMDVDEDDDVDTDNYRLLIQNDVLEKYRIVNDERVSSLNGQHGVRAKMNIPRNTVIGQYIGVEYLESEFHNAFIGTTENAQKNIYAFTLTVGGHETNNRSNSQSPSTPTKKIVIDAHGYSDNENKPLLIYINDCRRNISSKSKTSDDEKYENITFCKVSLNGWPSIFVITKRAIKKREQLLGFYGNDYWDAVQEKRLQETIQNRTRHLIDNNIIQGSVNVNSHHVNLM